MQQPPRRINTAGGLFAALIVLFIFGFFIGLPIVVWALLAAAFVGLWVATAGQRAQEKQTETPPPDRPWRNDRDTDK